THLAEYVQPALTAQSSSALDHGRAPANGGLLRSGITRNGMLRSTMAPCIESRVSCPPMSGLWWVSMTEPSRLDLTPRCAEAPLGHESTLVALPLRKTGRDQYIELHA